MELRYAFCAKYGEIGSGGEFTVVSGGIDSLKTPQLPVTIPAATLVARIVANEQDAQAEHRLRVDLLNPRGERVPIDIEFPLPQIPPPLLPGRNSSITLALTIGGLVFEEAGEYDFRISADGRNLGGIQILVILQAGQEGAAP